MSAQPEQLLEHFFRHESARLVAVLTRAFGARRIELVEDAVQAALLEAVRAWRQNGVPHEPAAWIHRVAKNRILDGLRRDEVHERAMAFARQSSAATESLVDEWLADAELPDSLLRMIFACCHSALDRGAQLALALKTLCAFGIEEIARALLISKESAKKRVQRAKHRLAELDIPIELPPPAELAARLESVHHVLYLLFNEGYSPARGADPIRDELCESAARLGHLLAEHELGTRTTYALLALMLFHGSRLRSRVDSEGAVILLEDQDRSRWDRRLISAAQGWLGRAGPKPGERLQPSPYHLEAAIAGLHCRAPSVEATDWAQIVRLYDRLDELRPSPVVRLNRALARAQAGELARAEEDVEAISRQGELDDYVLLDTARARIHELAGRLDEARAAYERALTRPIAEHERRLVERKLGRLRGR